MKKILTILLILLSSLTFSQNYKLFNASSKKLFTEYQIPHYSYSLAFDSVKNFGLDSVYFYFPLLNDSLDNDSICMWQQCNRQNVPSWIGRKIIFDNISDYHLFNLAGDTLNFNFTTNLNDTLLFYKDASQKFLFVYKKSDTLNTLNNIDSARFYTIIHTDLSGTIINSALNQQSIIISKNWGLTRFFQVDSFPQILKPVSLIGNISPTAGLYEITNEMLYDYQPGDEIQYQEYYSSWYNTPYLNYDKYEKYTILNRTMTTDWLIYKAAHELFYTDSSHLYIDTVNLQYYRHTVIATIPFDKYNGETRNLKLADYCGLKLWTYPTNSVLNYPSFCASDNCWCFDIEDQPVTIDTTYVIGLGIYLYHNYIYNPQGYSTGSEIFYFKKNGISCDTPAVVGIKELNNPINISIYPNPATDNIEVSSRQEAVGIIEIQNIQGQIIETLATTGNKTNINVTALAKGMYFVKVRTEKGVAVKKFIKE